MTPKETITSAINLYLKDNLINEGFQFSESSLTFNKKLKNGLKQQIKFIGNRNNISGQIIRYNEQYNVISNYYKKWTKENFPNSVPTEFIECNQLAFEGKNEDFKKGGQYDFVSFDSQKIMNSIWNNYLNHGKIFFENNDSWETISMNKSSSQRTDILILAERFDEAKIEVENHIKAYLDYYGGYDNLSDAGKKTVNLDKEKLEHIIKRL